MMQRATRTALGMLTALALGACAQPPQSTKSAAENSATSQPGVIVANPRVPEATEGSDPFPPLPDGYRGLGGAFMNQGTLVVVAPDMKAPMQKHDLSVALLHGMSAGHRDAKATVQESDCQGSGKAPDSAIVVQNLADEADEVAAGIACAELKHPGAHWQMSQLITKGDGYLSQVALRDADGSAILVYTEVNRFAQKLIGELGG
jgi:hypothetical protein